MSGGDFDHDWERFKCLRDMLIALVLYVVVTVICVFMEVF